MISGALNSRTFNNVVLSYVWVYVIINVRVRVVLSYVWVYVTINVRVRVDSYIDSDMYLYASVWYVPEH